MNSILIQWQNKVRSHFRINKNILNTIVIADYEAVVDKTEDDLQRALWKLNTTFSENNLKIFTAKTIVKAFKGSDRMTAWVVPDDKVN
jgi:hypothetical protein